MSQATTREPIALLLQEPLGKIGIEVLIEKVPGANWFARMNDIVMGDLPRIPLARLLFDVAVQKNVQGHVYWFHTHLDCRTMFKA